jgi:Uncharacterized protein family UPF0029
MLEDLENEVEAINSIYGEGTLKAAETAGVYVLQLPNTDASLRIQFVEDYPDAPPVLLGTQSAGEHTRKGGASYVLEMFREAVGRLFCPGEVCLYDVIEEVTATLSSQAHQLAENDQSTQEEADLGEESSGTHSAIYLEEPPWTLSDVIVELKSVFIARCAPVSSPEQAKQFLQHLLSTNKKVAKATHNITAWRIREKDTVTYQDCDDDGEAAAGGRVLHLMQIMDLWNVMVVVTRWYGGQKLGPARFGIINSVARDAFVKAGFVQDADSSKKKKGP